MSKLKPITIAIYSGIAGVVIGLVAFFLSWNLWGFWGGPMPGYQFFLYPGNLTLIYVWHPLFTEEVDFWQKLGLLMLGQFFLVFAVAGLLTAMVRKVSSACRVHAP